MVKKKNADCRERERESASELFITSRRAWGCPHVIYLAWLACHQRRMDKKRVHNGVCIHHIAICVWLMATHNPKIITIILNCIENTAMTVPNCTFDQKKFKLHVFNVPHYHVLHSITLWNIYICRSASIRAPDVYFWSV